MDGQQQSKSGFSFADDLMVDITGALFPGLLFIVILLLGIVLPLSTYGCGSLITIPCNLSGSLWWVILIALLIVSYVIGHAFFRADVIEPDRRDISRRIKEELLQGKKRYQQIVLDGHKKPTDYDTIEAELRDQINAFKTTLANVKSTKTYSPHTCEQPSNEADEIYSLLKQFCVKATEKKIEVKDGYPPVVLGVLFPEEVLRLMNNGLIKSVDDIKFEHLNADIQQTMNQYRKVICSNRKARNEAALKLIICSCILNIQSELGCISENNCTFPYVYYYKYLLKRNLSSYLDEVTWNADHSRSKNVINNYKIEIQMFAPEGYALVRRNESHIRMSSSTWHMAQPLKLLLSIVSLAKFISLFICDEGICIKFNNMEYKQFVLFLIPFCILLFLVYVQRRITHFIHYQRMREVFYTICIYDDYKDIITDKKKVKSNQKNYNVNIHESKIYTV